MPDVIPNEDMRSQISTLQEELAHMQTLILEQERENDIIQGLNTDFALIREKKDLLRIIHIKLKTLFDFGHNWVATVNDDELTMTCFLIEPESKSRNHPKYQEVIRKKYPISDRVFNRVLLSGDPVVFDLRQMASRGPMPEYLEMQYESSIRKVVLIGLHVATTFIGVWAICLLEDQDMNEKQLRFVKNIASQLAVAVANIKANDAIRKREIQQENLLRLSFDITTIRNRVDLQHVVNRNLRQFFKFQNIMIIVGKCDEQYQDSCFRRVKEAEGCVVFDMEQLSQAKDAPEYIKAEYQAGIREKVGIALRDDHDKLGILYINTDMKHAYSEQELALMNGISYQLSSAVTNILAIEEIHRREAERSLLLSLSMDIASVRDNSELLVVIQQRLRDLLGFSHNTMGVLNKEKSTFTAFLLDPAAKSRTHPAYTIAINATYPLYDGLMDKVYATGRPLIFDLESLQKERELPLYLRVNVESGLKQVCAVRFSRGGDVFGFWLLFFNEKVPIAPGVVNLIEGLANQISVAVSNIIANQIISNHLHIASQHQQQLEEEKIYLKEEIEKTQNYADIVGESAEVKKIFRLVRQVASSDSTVLIQGETGTGKELIAQAIHNNSPRKPKLMIKVNCAALPANLIESELFGHERGSFTGAIERRIGKFELANDGTLFLDEIGEMPLELQVKLLRALQEKEIERVGGKTTIKVNVRIVAATNRDLEKEMNEGRFRIGREISGSWSTSSNAASC
jgi:transcriptional regulator with GAF, ATPase, and Fis domain